MAEKLYNSGVKLSKNYQVLIGEVIYLGVRQDIIFHVYTYVLLCLNPHFTRRILYLIRRSYMCALGSFTYDFPSD